MIPLIIGGLALLAGGYGVKKGFDANDNYSKAKNLVDEANNDLGDVKEELERQKSVTNNGLKLLGVTRLNVESQLMPRFVGIVKQINKISYKPIVFCGANIEINAPALGDMELSSYQAADLLKDGVGAISAGVLTGIGAGGLASSIGVASTGAAIGGLSGAAATNATLAWLGGGSLAAGGMGMAGGSVVLGGAIAGPFIAIMGYSAAIKSELALTSASKKESEIRDAIEQVKNGICVLSIIAERTNEMQDVIARLSVRFEEILKVSEKVISDKKRLLAERQKDSEHKKREYAKKNVIVRLFNYLFGKTPSFTFQDPFNFNGFSEKEKAAYMMLTNFGYSLYALLKVKVIDDNGVASIESETFISEGMKLLGGD